VWPTCTVPTWATGTTLGAAHGTNDGARPTVNLALARPMRIQGRVGARYRGGGGRPDSGAGCQWVGLGTTSRVARLRGELDWGISKRSGSPRDQVRSSAVGARVLTGVRLGWPERPVDVDGLSGGWSWWRPVTLVQPLVRQLLGEVAHSRRRVARSRRLP
jgi:hypothetical protein